LYVLGQILKNLSRRFSLSSETALGNEASLEQYSLQRVHYGQGPHPHERDEVAHAVRIYRMARQGGTL
jgi:hypothetical protein